MNKSLTSRSIVCTLYSFNILCLIGDFDICIKNNNNVFLDYLTKTPLSSILDKKNIYIHCGGTLIFLGLIHTGFYPYGALMLKKIVNSKQSKRVSSGENFM